MTVVFTPAAKRGGSRVNFPESGGHPGEARLSEVRSSRGLLKRLLEGIFCEPRLYGTLSYVSILKGPGG